MKKKKIIAITGNIAGGKSNVANKIASKLDMESYCVSNIFRKLAREKDMDIATFNAYLESNSDIDKAIDKELSEYLEMHDNLVVDSRLAWYFEKNAFKVFVTVDLDVAAERLLKDDRNVEDTYNSIEEAKVSIMQRQNYERDRYKEEYGIDILDLNNYDLVVDSTSMSTEDMTSKIIDAYNIWLNRD